MVNRLTAVLTGASTCFVNVPAQFAQSLQALQLPFVLQLTWGAGKRAFVSCAGSTSADSDALEVPSRLAAALGIQAGETVDVSPFADAPVAQQVNVEPPSPDDWEILELQPDRVEDNLLSQLGVVYDGLTFPVTVRSGAVVHLRVVGAAPAGARCWRLAPNTEVVVAPNQRKREAVAAEAEGRGGKRAGGARTAVLRLLEDGARLEDDVGPPEARLHPGDCEALGVADGDVLGVAVLDCAGRPVAELLERLRNPPQAPQAAPGAAPRRRTTRRSRPRPPSGPARCAPPDPLAASACDAAAVALSPLLRRQLAAHAPFSRVRVTAGLAEKAAGARASQVTVRRLLLRPPHGESGEAPSTREIEEVFLEWVAGQTAGGKALALADGTWAVRRHFVLRFGGLAHGPATPPEVAGVKDGFADAIREPEAAGPAAAAPAGGGPSGGDDVAGARGAWEAASSFLLAASALRYCDPALSPERFPQFPGAFHLHGPRGSGKTWIAQAVAAWLGSERRGVRPDLPAVYTVVLSCRELARLGLVPEDPKDPALVHDPYGTQGRARSLAAFITRLAFPPRGHLPAPWQEIDGMDVPAVLRCVMRAAHPAADASRLDFAAVAHKADGYAPADLRRLAGRAVQAAAYRARLRGGPVRVTAADFEEQQARGFRPLSLEGVTLHKSERSWAEIGGLGAVRGAVLEMMQAPARYPEVFAQCPIRLPTGLLLYGPPGCGKTLLGHAAATECGLNFIAVKGPELLNKYIGASEAAVREVFARARAAAPALLFFDEFDALAPRRGHDSTGVTDRVVNQLLTELDGVDALRGVYVLAASSRPDLIDAALLRPGRLDRCLQLPLPAAPDRLEILRAQAAAGGFALAPEVDLAGAAGRTAGYSGADLRALLQSAHVRAARELLSEKRAGRAGAPVITGALLEAALATSRPSLSEADRRRFERIYSEFEADRAGGAPAPPSEAGEADGPAAGGGGRKGKGRKGKEKGAREQNGHGAANGGPHGSEGEEVPLPSYQRVVVQRATLM
eukprot:tig00021428_g21162.t1